VHLHIQPDKNRQDWTQRPDIGNLVHMGLVYMGPQELQAVLEELKKYTYKRH